MVESALNENTSTIQPRDGLCLPMARRPRAQASERGDADPITALLDLVDAWAIALAASARANGAKAPITTPADTPITAVARAVAPTQPIEVERAIKPALSVAPALPSPAALPKQNEVKSALVVGPAPLRPVPPSPQPARLVAAKAPAMLPRESVAPAPITPKKQDDGALMMMDSFVFKPAGSDAMPVRRQLSA